MSHQTNDGAPPPPFEASGSETTAPVANKLEEDLKKSAPRVMKHMNDDHGDSLVAYVLAFGVDDPSRTSDNQQPHQGAGLLAAVQNGSLAIASARLTDVRTDGFVLEVLVEASAPGSGEPGPSVLQGVLVPYGRPLSGARDLHAVAVELHHSAHHRLGVVYKARSGYYKGSVAALARRVLGKPKQRSAGWALAAAATAAIAAVAWRARRPAAAA